MVRAALPEFILLTSIVIDVKPPPDPCFLNLYRPRVGVPISTVPVPDVAPVEALIVNVSEPALGFCKVAKLNCVCSVMVASSTANAG